MSHHIENQSYLICRSLLSQSLLSSDISQFGKTEQLLRIIS